MAQKLKPCPHGQHRGRARNHRNGLIDGREFNGSCQKRQAGEASKLPQIPEICDCPAFLSDVDALVAFGVHADALFRVSQGADLRKVAAHLGARARYLNAQPAGIPDDDEDDAEAPIVFH